MNKFYEYLQIVFLIITKLLPLNLMKRKRIQVGKLKKKKVIFNIA